MAIVEDVKMTLISSLKPETKCYIGEGAGMSIPDIGDILIIAENRDKVLRAFKLIENNFDEQLGADKDRMRKIAVIQEKDITY